MTDGSLMKVESILQYFWPAWSDNWSWKPILVFFRVVVLDRVYCTCWCFIILKNQSVHEKFETLLKEILQERDVQVIYGTVWKSGWKSVSADDINEDELMLLNANPLTVIMECMRLQNFRLVELLKTFDTDNNRKLSIDELVNGLLVSVDF